MKYNEFEGLYNLCGHYCMQLETAIKYKTNSQS